MSIKKSLTCLEILCRDEIDDLPEQVQEPERRDCRYKKEREFFIDNLLVLIHFIILMSRWTGLAPWEFEFPFPGSLTSTFIGYKQDILFWGSVSGVFS